MSAAGSGRRSRTAAAGTSASRRACAPAATPAWFRIRETRGRAVARVFDFTAQLGDEGWSGDGYELANAGSIEIPEQAELPLEMAARLEPGCTNPRRPSPIRRPHWRPRNRCPTRPSQARAPSARWRRKIAALAARPAAARAAAPSAGSAGGGARTGGAAFPRAARAWIDRPGDLALGRRGPRRHRGARSRHLVRRRLARRGAADRHGEDAARHLHRERPGRPATVSEPRC